MRRLSMLLLVLVAMVGVFALVTTTPADAAPRSCAHVRCASCPPGYHLLLQWPNCCTCVPN